MDIGGVGSIEVIQELHGKERNEGMLKMKCIRDTCT